jgi:hypothetical protein
MLFGFTTPEQVTAVAVVGGPSIFQAELGIASMCLCWSDRVNALYLRRAGATALPVWTILAPSISSSTRSRLWSRIEPMS